MRAPSPLAPAPRAGRRAGPRRPAADHAPEPLGLECHRGRRPDRQYLPQEVTSSLHHVLLSHTLSQGFRATFCMCRAKATSAGVARRLQPSVPASSPRAIIPLMSVSRRDFLKSAGVTSLATAVTTVAVPDA